MLRALRDAVPDRVQLDQKTTLISLRGVVSLLMIFFLVYNPNADLVGIWTPFLLVAAHAASDLGLIWVPRELLERTVVQAGIFLFDIVVISGLIYFCEGFDSDLYLIYFVVVLMSSLQMRIWQSLLVALAASAVYLTLWSKSNPSGELWDTHILLRLPFFYIVAVVAAFFAHHAREREEMVKEASAQEDRARLRAVFGQMQAAAVLTDDRGAIVMHNEAARRFFAIAEPPRGSLAEHLAGMKVSPPVRELLGGASPVAAFEAVREEPKLLVLAGAASVLRFEAAETESPWRGHLFVFRDVTAERQEGMLKRSFLFLISHKLKTPLTLIVGFAHHLRGELGTNPPAGWSAGLDSILTQGTKLSGLIEKLLDFIAIESLEPSRLDRKGFVLAETVAEAVKPLAPWLAERRAVLEIAVDPGLRAFGDEALIGRALKNLVENGVKFNGKPSKHVRVEAAERDGLIAVSVRDDGDGIPPEDREKILQRFHQVEASFTGNVEGWGLGLPFAKKVLEFHGGKLSVESRMNEGTTVRFTLERDAAPVPAAR